ncbi:MAG: anaerobic glycerol-3-phosphate dehydrogenase subunit A, partial [Chloroflexi bacterium]|nr:anaerobic glycerol-3-phosphate dehydrogenase subunit A [Chloroflexota bacterium]
DIIVPIHTVAVLGTTDERVADPEHLTIEPWEIELLLREGDQLVPGVSRARFVRAWAGVRPLYQEHYNGASRDATRDLTLLDHQARDGVAGLLTILGGKWTTFRLMAEITLNKACEYLGAQKPCITAQTVVPGVEHGPYWLGHRLHEVEENYLQSELICECELVTRYARDVGKCRAPSSNLFARRFASRCATGNGTMPGRILHVSRGGNSSVVSQQ